MSKTKDNKATKDEPSVEPDKKPLAAPSILKGNPFPTKREDF